MEDLTKHQLVLVALLVSFVTSIATGIFTVALMEQAPQGVTQTVNHVIQETVEKVVPDTTTAAVSAAGSSNTGQVKVVSDDTLAVSAIAQNSKSIVRISNGTDADSVFLGLGVILSKDGYILANTSVISGGTIYDGTLSNGTTTPLEFVGQNEGSGLAYFKFSDASSTTDGLSQLIVPIAVGNSDNVMDGESVIAMGGQQQDVINRGTVTSLIEGKSGLNSIDTDVSFTQATENDLILLIDLNGNTVGFGPNEVGAGDSTSYLPINIIQDQLAAIRAASVQSNQTTTATSTATTTQTS